MRLSHRIVALLVLPVFVLVSSPAFAQTRVVDESAMRQALAGKADTETAQRALVQRVLQRDEVKTIAARMGLDVTQASSAVATLSGAELDTLAQQATAIDAASLAGGANTVVISLTTLLLIVIIVILIAR